MAKLPNKKYTVCPYCKSEGLHYFHHVYGGSRKKKSEQYGAIIYPCLKCHTGNTDSIHKQQSQEKTKALKREHQSRIMEEYNMDTETFISIFGQNYL